MQTPSTSGVFGADLRAMPRAFWVLVVGAFINRFGTFVTPFLTIYLWKNGHSLGEAAWAVSAYGVGGLTGSMVGGWLADRAGRKHTIVIGTFGSAAANILLYFVKPMPLIMLCAALAGLAGATYPPASSALLADVIPEERRVRAWAALRTAVNAGFAFGTSSAGFLAKISFFWLFAGDALTSVVYGIIALLWLPHGLRSSTRQAPWSEALRDVRRNRSFQYGYAGALCSALVFSQFGTAYSAHLVSLALSLDLFGVHFSGETFYGLLIGWNGALVMLTQLQVSAVAQCVDPRKAMAWGYLLVGLGFAANALAHSVLTLFIAMTVFTLGEMISAPVANAYLSQLAPERLRGRYMGLVMLLWGFSSIVGPPVGLRLLERGSQLGWVLCGILGILGAAFVLRAKNINREREPDESEPEPHAVATAGSAS